MIVDSSGLGVGAVVMVVQGGASVGKMMGMAGVGRGVDGTDGVQEDKVMTRMMESGKPVLSRVEGRKEERRIM
jgi:hypothetical protein